MSVETNRMPPKPAAATSTSPDVVVVGLGPVGITLCNLLATQGLQVVGIDSAAEVYDLPRAIGMDHEVMRVFQSMGVAEELEPFVSEYRPSEYHSADGRLLRRFESPAEPFPLAWSPYLTFLQPDLERVLRGNGRRHENLSLHVLTQLVALENPDAPVLTMRDNRSGETTTLRPRYVVGCDGGNSFVRRTLGIEFEDLIFDEPWLVVDVVVADESVVLPDTNIQFCNPERPHTFVVGPGHLRRWEFMLLPGEAPATLNRPDRIWELLAPWLRPDQGRLWRSSAYNFHALVARQWRHGSVFLAGDACHMTPPFLAQGMVQGIKDVSNLAWKLARAVKDGHADLLLDSYQSERRPLVRQVISTAKELGRVICELDPEKARIRNDQMIAQMEEGKGLWIRQDLFPPIGDGIIGRSEDGAPSAGAGKPSPQPWVVSEAGRQRLDDVVKPGFGLFTGPDFALPAALLEQSSRLGIAVHRISSKASSSSDMLAEEHTVFSDWLRAHDAKAVLVRPDHVVFGTAPDIPGLQSLLYQLQSMLTN